MPGRTHHLRAFHFPQKPHHSKRQYWLGKMSSPQIHAGESAAISVPNTSPEPPNHAEPEVDHSPEAQINSEMQTSCKVKKESLQDGLKSDNGKDINSHDHILDRRFYSNKSIHVYFHTNRFLGSLAHIPSYASSPPTRQYSTLKVARKQKRIASPSFCALHLRTYGPIELNREAHILQNQDHHYSPHRCHQILKKRQLK